MKECKRICVVLFATVMMFFGVISSVSAYTVTVISQFNYGGSYTVYANEQNTIRYESRTDSTRNIRLAEEYAMPVYRIDGGELNSKYSISFREVSSGDPIYNITFMFPEPGSYRIYIERDAGWLFDQWGVKEYAWQQDKYLDITVKELPISSINIAHDSFELKPGENVKLGVTYLPAHATYPEISYSSNASNVAYVDSQGTIHAVNSGNAMVFANSVRSNASDYCWVHVHNIVSYDGKEATATESGWEAYEACNLYNACTGGLCEYTTYQEIPALGCNVSGTITSAGSSTDSVTVELYGQGATTPSYSTTVTGNNASYSLVGVAPGIYTMKVSKAYHMTQEVTVIVDDANVMKDVELALGVGEVEFKIESASLAINQDINITYKTYVPESFLMHIWYSVLWEKIIPLMIIQ